jgi:GntR family transcriptional regulator/MocR family aminotransferase
MDRSIRTAVERSKTGADFLQLDPAEAPAGGLSAWLAAKLRDAIADGRLPVGSRLPASRQLAAELHVSRGVVTEAYQRLSENGQLVAYGRAGTLVAAVPEPLDPIPDAPVRPIPTAPLQTAALFSAARGTGTLDLFRSASTTIDLSPGLPDLTAFPRSAWLRAERAVLSSFSASNLAYGDPCGAPVFRVAVSRWLARNRGIQVDPAELIIVAGVAQALALLARVLAPSGITRIAVEDPGSLGAREQLQAWGIRTPPVPVDSAGLVVEELHHSTAAAVLLTPAHQFPTGVVLSGERRRELLAWTKQGGLIIEDDYDAEHRYDRPPVASLRAVAPEQVCYAGSVSKLLAPALRVGWMLVPAQYRESVVAAKRDTDLGNAVLPQLVLARLMESGDLERHLRLLRRRHQRRRDAMITALSSQLPEAEIHGAAAGLHLMISFATALSDVDLAAAAFDRGVKVQPLSWHCQMPHKPGLVLGYAANPVSMIEQGISLLADSFGGLHTASRSARIRKSEVSRARR